MILFFFTAQQSRVAYDLTI